MTHESGKISGRPLSALGPALTLQKLQQNLDARDQTIAERGELDTLRRKRSSDSPVLESFEAAEALAKQVARGILGAGSAALSLHALDAERVELLTADGNFD